MRYRSVVAFVICAGLGVSLLSFAGIAALRPKTAQSALLEAVVLSPAARQVDGKDYIESEPAVFAEFRYELRNVSDRMVRLRPAKLFCACSLTQQPASVLEPGEATVLGLRFNAPPAGERSEEVIIRTTESWALVLRPTIRTKLEAPCLVKTPEQLTLQAAAGERVEREIIIETVEKKGSNPMLKGFEQLPPELVRIEFDIVHDSVTYDPDNVFRRYDFHVVLDPPANATPGVGHVVLTPKLFAEAAGTVRDLEQFKTTVDFTILPQVSIVPPKLSFRVGSKDTPPKSVWIIRRGETAESAERAVVKEHDPKLVLVTDRSTADSQVFEITPAPGLDPATREALVRFQFGSQMLDLPITFSFNEHASN